MIAWPDPAACQRTRCGQMPAWQALLSRLHAVLLLTVPRQRLRVSALCCAVHYVGADMCVYVCTCAQKLLDASRAPGCGRLCRRVVHKVFTR